MILKALLLGVAIKILNVTEKPMHCAVGYTVALFLFGLAMGLPLLALSIGSAIWFAAAWLYFFLLDWFDETGWWFAILILGLPPMILL